MLEDVETIEGLNKATKHLIKPLNSLKDVRKQQRKTLKIEKYRVLSKGLKKIVHS
ncbi:MAG: hypothetical protein QXP59_04755 [Saccharolobus sp.]